MDQAPEAAIVRDGTNHHSPDGSNVLLSGHFFKEEHMPEILWLPVTFLHPEKILALALLLPAIVALFMWHFVATKRVLRNNSFLALHKEEADPRVLAYATRTVGYSLVMACLVFVWAEPLWQTRAKSPVYGGVRIAFLKDVSPSMKWAHDVLPFPDRLTAAKSVLADFATMTEKDPELRGTYYRAIIPFAGSAIPYMPFSNSYDEFIDAIDAIDETTINDPGTYILGAFKEYERMVKSHPSPDQDTVDIVVLVSDGGKEEGNYKDLQHITSLLRRVPHTIVYTVGIGKVEITKSEDGTEVRKSVRVPLIARDKTGAFAGYALEDPSNPKSKPLFSELDEKVLTEISGKDRYVHYTNKDDLIGHLKQAILEHRKTIRTETRVHNTPIGHWFLIPALLVACIVFGYVTKLLSSVRASFKTFMRFLGRINHSPTPDA